MSFCCSKLFNYSSAFDKAFYKVISKYDYSHALFLTIIFCVYSEKRPIFDVVGNLVSSKQTY